MSRIADKIKRIFGFRQEMIKPSVIVAGTQAFKSMKPHIAMIKFRSGTNHAITTAHPSIPVKSSPSSTKTQPASRVTTSSGTIEDWQLPAQYRRRPIGEEEIAYINRGGPA